MMIHDFICKYQSHRSFNTADNTDKKENVGEMNVKMTD